MPKEKPEKVTLIDEYGETVIGIDVMEFAKFIHEKYRYISKEFGWEIQKEMKRPYEKLSVENQKVLFALAIEIVEWFNGQLKVEKDVDDKGVAG